MAAHALPSCHVVAPCPVHAYACPCVHAYACPCVHAAPRGGRRESGFTMIELLVAMVLMAVVVGVAGTAVISAFSGATGATTVAGARASAAEAAERFGSDVRAARSKGRDGSGAIDVADFRKAMSTNGLLHDLDGEVLDWRDIVHASPTAITFQSDVVDEVGVSLPECVTWRVVDAAGGWHVERLVRAYTFECGGQGVLGGGGAEFERDAVSDPVAASLAPRPGSGAPPLFTYEVAQVAGNSCTMVQATGTLGAQQRNRTLSVRLDFSSLTQQHGGASRSALRQEVGLRSRAASDYQYAVECGGG